MIFSLEAFSQSHGYILHDNGTVSVMRNRAFTESEAPLLKPTSFFNSYNLEEAKTHYLIDKKDVLYTIDSNGFLYQKKFYEVEGKMRELGGSFFTTSKNLLYVVSKEGFIIAHKEVGKLKFSRIRHAGGNHLITRGEELVVTRSDGSYVNMTQEFKHKSKDIAIGGNNYFITSDGTLYVIAEEEVFVSSGKPTKMSFVYRLSLESVIGSNRVEDIVSIGGNYFFDKDLNLHTISLKGLVDQGITGRKLKVSDVNGRVYNELPAKLGSSYFTYSDGFTFQVVDDGLYYELGRLDRDINFTNFHSFTKK